MPSRCDLTVTAGVGRLTIHLTAHLGRLIPQFLGRVPHRGADAFLFALRVGLIGSLRILVLYTGLRIGLPVARDTGGTSVTHDYIPFLMVLSGK